MEKDIKQVFNPYEVYITKLFRSVPKNCALLVKNVFNGSKIEVKTGGFAIIMPWQKSKLVSLAVKNFDYPEMEFEDSKGQNILIDLAVTVRVKDPIKYEYENTNVEAELKQLITSQMRILINKSEYSRLKSTRFNVNSYSVEKYGTFENIYRINGEPISFEGMIDEDKNLYKKFIESICDFRSLLNNFADRYGLEVVDLYNKKVEQSQEMQEAYNKKVKAEKEAEAALIMKNAELEKARIDAEILKVQAEAKAEADAKVEKAKLTAIIDVLKDTKMTEEEKVKFLQAYMYSNGKENTAGATAAAIAGATAGITSSMTSEATGKTK